MMADVDIRTSPKKRGRKPQAKSLPLRAAILEVAADYERMSIRQLFYQLVSRGAIDKTESAYKQVADFAVQMRLDGSLPYSKIAGGHRTRRRVYSHSGLQDALENAHDMYRRNYWLDQLRHVEVWSEKDALTGIIQPVCEDYGVTYVTTRGFPSLAIRFESATAITEIGKPATIFYFGDHNASGQQISTNLEEELRQFGADVTVQRVALNPHQIRRHAMPTRPGKRTDSRHAAFAAEFGDASVELDALRPNVLNDYVERSILSAITDIAAWHAAADIEESERETFRSLSIAQWQPGVLYSAPSDKGEAA